MGLYVQNGALGIENGRFKIIDNFVTFFFEMTVLGTQLVDSNAQTHL